MITLPHLFIENTLAEIPAPEMGVITAQWTGSYYICNPPITNTDIDVLILVENLGDYKTTLMFDGWILGGSEVEESHFFSFKKKEYNLIVTEELQWYLRFAAATELAKKHNLLDKRLRVELFQQVLGEKGEKQEPSVPMSSIYTHTLWPGLKKMYGGT